MSDTHAKSIIRLGLDDTDHVDHACTTEHFNRLLSRLEESIDSFEIIERRLVRLWPFAPKRTRGNAALGAICELKISHLRDVESICQQFIDDLHNEIKSTYPETGERPSPCLITTTESFPESLYWKAVRGEVSLGSVLNRLPSSSKFYSIKENPTGIIGASAAIAWNPKENYTWELIAWRFEDKIRTVREVSIESIESMSKKFTTTFANRDPTTGRGLIMPRTNCPVLYGIRGGSPEELQKAHEFLQLRKDVEESNSWAIHRTNQVSDDHVLGSMTGIVSSFPVEVQGGHSSVVVWTGSNSLTLIAYAESGPVNTLLRRFLPGDIIEWVGLISPTNEIHLERLRVNSATPRIGKRPECCGKAMRSAGSGQGLRCRLCGEVAEKVWEIENVSFTTPHEGWVEPNPANRRHLAKPLQRGLPKPQNNQV
ncbi:MAG: DUF1743 domain-containing protein [Euryarchaeota archaeon]|nr:DUF1743 domain-containing protein [Euryarchaeota archaeon]